MESTNTQARNLLDKVNTELKRILIRPKAQQLVETGYALLQQGKIQEARIEADNALQLDPTFEPAQALQRRVQQEFDRSQLVSQYLEDAKLRLVEGMPEEASGSSAQGSRTRALEQTGSGFTGTSRQRKSGTGASSTVARHDATGAELMDAAEIWGLP